MVDIKFIHGDCLEEMPKLADKSIDMILCDLPYGTTACKWDTVIPFEPLWTQYRRITKKNAAIVLTASQPFTTALIARFPPLIGRSRAGETMEVSGVKLIVSTPYRKVAGLVQE